MAETLVEMAALVRRMRQAQRDYFKTRSTAALDESRRLEREVDRAVAGVLEGPSLFGEEGDGRGPKPLEDLIQIAASDLPEGHAINIYVENGYGDAILEVDGEECEPPGRPDRSSMAERVAFLLDSLGIGGVTR